MLIGELSRKSGLPLDTIRWYEKIGLLNVDEIVRNDSNYKVYNNEMLDRLTFIRQTKSFGFTLNEIKEILSLMDAENLNCDVVTPIVNSRIKAIDHKINCLQNFRLKLTELLEQCGGDCHDQIKRSRS